MALFQHGEMLTNEVFEHYAAVLVTANNCLKKDGTPVMGAGAASQLDRYLFGKLRPSIKIALGKAIKENMNEEGIYGVVLLDYKKQGIWITGADIGLFQTKKHWSEPSSLELIRFSCESLAILANGYYKNGLIALNFPGIGKGGLHPRVVGRECLSLLPDNVIIWTNNVHTWNSMPLSRKI